ncbi:SKI/DACH domain-containing protein 1 [Pantherophis guttatus]|uniref:SKI/DACH domain-containing protein 1 n=1 Tax=Pantherophis guttatus TaxID=94885 RepID=A0A6P9ALF5_PANGU|nr:SKI/DACH domain-containing protein 1 [Pantherophis guttatus]
MEDLKSGFEEVDGVRLGYLMIRGKQMFPLSQVFTDLLKNIPRTTVHKRMDHLKVQKHQCDLEELRKLKSINSIAFHAAKCTLISREDVEALYTSCKTERVLRTKRRGGAKPGQGTPCPDPYPAFWKDGGKLCPSLKEGTTNQASSRKKAAWRKAAAAAAAAQAGAFLPASDLPHFWSKSAGRSLPNFGRLPSNEAVNYETAQLGPGYVSLATEPACFQSLLCSKHPHYYYHSSAAIATQPKIAAAAAAAAAAVSRSKPLGLGCRTKRKKSTERRFSAGCGRRVLILPRACKAARSAVAERLPGLCGFLTPQPAPALPDPYSSDSESSSYSNHADNDSDFCSSLSSTSSSGSSEEEEEEGSCASESSELSSDEEEQEEEEDEEEEEEEETSSESDSSSGSSHVSVQSIRFRRTSFCKSPTLQTSAGLVPHPTHFAGHEELPGPAQFVKCEASEEPEDWKIPAGWFSKAEPGLDCTTHPAGSAYLGLLEQPTEGAGGGEGRPLLTGEDHSTLVPEVKSLDLPGVPWLACGDSSSLKPNYILPQARFGEGQICQPALASHPHSSPLSPTGADSTTAALTHLSKELLGNAQFNVRSATCQGTAAVASPDLQSHVQLLSFVPIAQIKVEDSSANAEYGALPVQIPLKWEESDQETKMEADCQSSPQPSPTQHPGTLLLSAKADPTCLEDCPRPPKSTLCPASLSRTLAACTLGPASAAKPEDGDYKFGARVRKNYRTLVLGKRATIPSPAPLKPNLKSARNPRPPPGKLPEAQEGGLDDLSVLNRRKRVASNVTSTLKRPFSLMGNFPCPPSLMVGPDGDLMPAYTLSTTKSAQLPPKAHPFWKWQLGGPPIPLPPSHKFRKLN